MSVNEMIHDFTYREGLDELIAKANSPQYAYISKLASELKQKIESNVISTSSLKAINEDEEEKPTPTEHSDSTSPINGIILVTPLDEVPEGYTVLETTIGGRSANLNKYGKGKDRFLALSRNVANTLPITNMTCIYPKLGEEHPPTFLSVSGARYSRNGQFNKNKKGNRLNICVSRDGRLPPIIDVVIVDVEAGEEIPDGYNAVSFTPMGFTANIYNGKKHQESYICFKRDLTYLDHLKESENAEPVKEQKFSMLSMILCPLSMAIDSMSEINYVIDRKSICSYRTLNEQADQLVYLHPFIYAVLSGNPELMNIALSIFRILVTKQYFRSSEIVSPIMELCVPVFCRSCMALLPLVHIQLQSFIRDLLASNIRGIYCLQSIWETLMECYIIFTEHEAIFTAQCNKEDTDNSANKNISWTRELTNCKADKKSALQDILDATDILSTRVDEKTSNSKSGNSFINSIISDVVHEATISSTLTRAFTYLSRISPFNNKALLIHISPLLSSININSDRQNLLLPLLISIQYARLPIKQNKRNILRRLVALEVIKHYLTLDDPFQDAVLSREIIRTIVVPSILINFRGDTIAHPEIFDRVMSIVELLTTKYSKAVPLRVGVIWSEIFNNLLVCNLVDNSFKMPIIRQYQQLYSNPDLLAFFFRAFDNNYESLLDVVRDGLKSMSKIVHQKESTNESISSSHPSYETIVEVMKCYSALCKSLKKLAQDSKNTGRNNKARRNSSYTTITIYDNVDSEHIDKLSRSLLPELGSIKARKARRTAATKRETKEVEFVNHVNDALSIIADKEDVTKGIKYLEKTGDLKHLPSDICRFLWKYKSKIDPRFIGDYIGKGGDIGEEGFYKDIRYTYIRALDFTGLDLVTSMRILLTKGGFFLPGEGQKIDRIIEAFTQCYYENNPTTFKNMDVLFIVAYSVVMCNTDLHNSKLKDHMTLEGYINLVKNDPKCEDLDDTILENIYNSISQEEIYIPGFKGDVDDANAPVVSNDILLQEFMDNHVNSALALLRNARFISPLMNDIYDLTQLMIEKLFYIIIDDLVYILSNSSDSQLLKLSVEIIHSIYIASIYVEIDDYCSMYKRLLSDIYWKCYRIENVSTLPASIADLSSGDNTDNINTVVSMITTMVMTLNKLIDQMTDSQVSKQSPYFKELNEMVFSNHIHKGPLVKVCSTGKKKMYTFYLFCNCLVYASNSAFSSKKKTHLVIPLTSLTVEKEEGGLYIQSDKKSFHVLCDEETQRKWYAIIEKTKNNLFSGLF